MPGKMRLNRDMQRFFFFTSAVCRDEPTTVLDGIIGAFAAQLPDTALHVVCPTATRAAAATLTESGATIHTVGYDASRVRLGWELDVDARDFVMVNGLDVPATFLGYLATVPDVAARHWYMHHTPTPTSPEHNIGVARALAAGTWRLYAPTADTARAVTASFKAPCAVAAPFTETQKRQLRERPYLAVARRREHLDIAVLGDTTRAVDGAHLVVAALAAANRDTADLPGQRRTATLHLLGCGADPTGPAAELLGRAVATMGADVALYPPMDADEYRTRADLCSVVVDVTGSSAGLGVWEAAMRYQVPIMTAGHPVGFPAGAAVVAADRTVGALRDVFVVLADPTRTTAADLRTVAEAARQHANTMPGTDWWALLVGR